MYAWHCCFVVLGIVRSMVFLFVCLFDVIICVRLCFLCFIELEIVSSMFLSFVRLFDVICVRSCFLWFVVLRLELFVRKTYNERKDVGGLTAPCRINLTLTNSSGLASSVALLPLLS